MEAGNGLKTLELVRQHPFGLILLDVMMPSRHDILKILYLLLSRLIHIPQLRQHLRKILRLSTYVKLIFKR